MALTHSDVEAVSTLQWCCVGRFAISVLGEVGRNTSITQEQFSSIYSLGLTSLLFNERTILIPVAKVVTHAQHVVVLAAVHEFYYQDSISIYTF